MSDLIEFAQRIKEQVTAANREPHWAPGEADQYMEAVANRRERFEQLATRLIQSVIRPRLETLAGYFSNANISTKEPTGHCSYWFGYCDRFPASTKLSFAVEHDVRFDNAAICYEASMIPMFIKFNEGDRLTLPLDAVSDDSVAEWVEDRLVEFLSAYLRIDRGSDDLDEEAVTDPVCGMRISRSAAAASYSHCGHPYFFCSSHCKERFAQDPAAYVTVKTF